MTQAECFAAAPQGNVTQASHKYVTKPRFPSPTQPKHKIPGEADQP